MQLVINTFGASLQRAGELFKIKAGEKAIEIAARRIRSILLTTGIHFSSDAILLAIEHNIDVVMLDKYGAPYGRFCNGKMGSIATIRRKQLEYADSQDGLRIIKNWSLTKLENQRQFLLELLRRRPGQESLLSKIQARLG